MGAHQLKTAQDWAEKIEELPTLPTIVYELTQIVNDPLASTTDVEKIMKNDQSLTTKVLKLVNSAYYAIPGGVSSLARAIGYIGFDTVHQLVLSASIIETMGDIKASDFNMKEFWKHCVGAGIASETIAKKIDHPSSTDLFTAGLIHDIGKVAMLALEPAYFENIAQKAKEDQSTFLEAEKKLNLISHTKIGEALTKKWRLPVMFQNIARYHHEHDINKRSTLSSEMQKNVDICLAANLLIHALKFGQSGDYKIAPLQSEVAERLNLDPETDIKKLAKQIKINLEKSDEFTKVLGT